MTMNYLILDCDGVVSSTFSRPPREYTGWNGAWTAYRIDGQSVLWSHELVAALRRLNERDDLTILWNTDWQAGINEFARVARLPVFDYLPATIEDIETVSPWWKVPLVQSIYSYNPNSKIVWADDGIPFNAEARAFVNGKENLLAVAPDTNFGLTKAHIKIIEDFLN